MVKNKPIICPNCGKVVVEDESTLTFLYLKKDINCPNCNTVVIRTSTPVY